MTTNIHSERRMRAQPQTVAVRGTTGPDPAWRGLYKAGGISAILYMLLSLIVPALMIFTSPYDFVMDGAALLAFIAEHRLWWIGLQTLVLESSILAIVAFAALFVALKHVNNTLAAIGAIVGSVAQILYMAYYPVLLGLVYLSEQYMAAADAQKAVFATAAEALIAQNNAFNPIYEPLFAAGILILSLAMLRGLFHKSIAYLGIASFFACVGAMTLWPIVGIGYFWWWFFPMIWFIVVGWKLYQLGR